MYPQCGVIWTLQEEPPLFRENGRRRPMDYAQDFSSTVALE
jgi:hypothetical protein